MATEHPLLALLGHLRRRPADPVPAELAAELLPLLAAYAAGADFDQAYVAAARRRRNAALRRASELLDLDGGTWSRAGHLAAALRHADRISARPRTPAEVALAAALAAGPVPRTQRRLYEALRD